MSLVLFISRDKKILIPIAHLDLQGNSNFLVEISYSAFLFGIINFVFSEQLLECVPNEHI